MADASLCSSTSFNLPAVAKKKIKKNKKTQPSMKNKLSEIGRFNQLEEKKSESCGRLQLEIYPMLVD